MWKGNSYYSFTDVFAAVPINFHNKVSFHIAGFKNFFLSSSISFTISGAQSNEAGYKKNWFR